MASAAPQRRYVVATHRLFAGPSQTAISVSRMDSLPERDRLGEPYRSDRDAWLTEEETMEHLRRIVRALPGA